MNESNLDKNTQRKREHESGQYYFPEDDCDLRGVDLTEQECKDFEWSEGQDE